MTAREATPLEVRARAAHALLAHHPGGTLDPWWLLGQIVAPTSNVLERSLEYARQLEAQ